MSSKQVSGSLLHPKRKELRLQKEELLEVLEEFANLEIGTAGLGSFRKTHPAFFPLQLYSLWRNPFPFPEGVVVGENIAGLRELQANAKSKPFLSFYQELLRNAWASGFQEDDTLTLLGMPRDSESYFDKLPLGKLRFSNGTFQYQPTYDFAKAVLFISKTNWKAKVCLSCRRCFIGEKSPYCSDKCRQEGRRETKRQSWHEHKSEWRHSKAANKGRGRK
jgi:hypothetical protein